MGWFPCECCNTCECLSSSELPAISISGFTSVDSNGNPSTAWGLGPCCNVRYFVPTNTPAWTKSCAGPYIESTYIRDSTAKLEILRRQRDKIFEVPQNEQGCDFGGADIPDPLSDVYCCKGTASTLVMRTRGYTNYNVSKKFNVWYRLKRIRVYYFRRIIQCTEGSESCKYGVIVTKEFEAKYSTLELWTKTAEGEILEVGPCFKKNPNGSSCDNPPCPEPCEFDTVTSGTESCDDEPTISISFLSLSRMRFFDNPPTGSQVFDNSNLGNEDCQCMQQGCCYENNAINDFDLNICLSPAPEDNPCWCSGELNSNITYTHATDVSSCTCSIGGPEIQLICCLEIPISIVIGNQFCDETSRTCNDVTCIHAGGFYPSDCTGSQLSTLISRGVLTQYGQALPPMFPFENQCIGGRTTPGFGCVTIKTFAEAPNCYESQPCDDTKWIWENQYTTGQLNTFATQLTDNLTISCSGFMPVQVCIPFGSVTVVFPQ